MLDELTFHTTVREFMRAARPEAAWAGISSQSDLHARGILDSLLLTELILFLEGLVGSEIAVENYRLEAFYTLDSLYRIAAETVRSGASVQADGDDGPGGSPRADVLPPR
ncbi:hypothetical protein GCM10010211_82570 [Streptomyces albospinus]|uniref:Carrier domain-containing protein n=1 Tax=Streptomyces albospinus TaxID=285515 RepID=A0ABQ2VR70_9ACTN|nr:hypothetical protein [Streptomyces albospinus]GGV02788.1 hypothetical protein GCM10010211_82570 [Streptomyces albospinus]